MERIVLAKPELAVSLEDHGAFFIRNMDEHLGIFAYQQLWRRWTNFGWDFLKLWETPR